MIFVFQSWDQKSLFLKQIVARYSVSAGISGEFLSMTFEEVICALYIHGLIVINITADGAAENRSCFKQLATFQAQDLFKATPGKQLPNPKLPVAFLHLSDDNLKVFIGGEMPHLVKKIANAMYRSSRDDKSTNLIYKGKEINLNMIKVAWESVDQFSMGGIRLTKCTEDHFNRNQYNSMRVYLATQVFSQSVINMVKVYINSFPVECMEEIRKNYEPLLIIIDKLDRLIDIWNGNRSKGCECINSRKHNHIQELREILDTFNEWKHQCTNVKVKFIPEQSWEDLCWLVYGIEGVATTYLFEETSRVMVQRRGGSDVCENMFAEIRFANQRPTGEQASQVVARRSGFRGAEGKAFTRIVKTNSDRGEIVDLDILCKDIKKTKKIMQSIVDDCNTNNK